MILFMLACAADRGAADKGAAVDSVDSGVAAAWTVSEPELVLSGGYADPSVLRFRDRLWMYCNTVAEDPGGTLLYTSDDGVDWTRETPVIFAGVATGRAVAMHGGVRFYYPARGPAAEQDQPASGDTSLYSAFSADGVAFYDDDGARIDGLDDPPGGPSVFELSDGSWRLLFNITVSYDIDVIVDQASIWGASSADGLSWAVDDSPSLEGSALEGTDPVAQVLHPEVFAGSDDAWWMIYNAHTKLFLARSEDGVTWEKRGPLGLEGADASVLQREDGGWKLWFGRYSDGTGGEIWTSDLYLEE